MLKKLSNNIIEILLVSALCLNVVIVFVQVIFRYVLNDSLSWSEELSRILLVWITLLGAALAVRNGEEISIDVFIKLIPNKIQTHVNTLATLISTIILIILIKASVGLFFATQTIKTVALDIPTAYIYFAFTVGGVLMVIYSLCRIIRDCKSAPATIITVILTTATFLCGYLLFYDAVRHFIASHMVISMLIGIISVLVMGLPIGIIMLMITVVFIWVSKDIPMPIVPQRLVQGIDNFSLLAIPFFMVAGELMNAGGITGRCVNFASSIVGHLRGGLAYVAVVVNMIMAGMSGSAVADVSGTGSVLIPAMEKKGYDKSFACGLIASAGTIGSLVPPSIAFVIYGVLGGVSIAKLYLAGIVPGVLVGLFLMAASYLVSRKRNYPREEKPTMRGVYKSFREAIPALMLPVILMGGILSGVFTATEASAVTVVYAFVIGLLYYKTLKFASGVALLKSISVKIASVMFIIGAASGISWLIAREQITISLLNYIGLLTNNPWVLLLLINIGLIILGCMMETISVAIILIPLVIPLITRFGIDPVHYGVIQTLNLQIGLITPPVGISMFLVCKIGNISIKEFLVEAYPFLIALFLALFLITYVPAFTLFVPKLFMGS